MTTKESPGGISLAESTTTNKFPISIIEVPKASYHNQSKTAMMVASKNMGGPNYAGPLRLCQPRWKHISTFYIYELSAESYYLAQSLTSHPHYSVLRSEFEDFDKALTQFQAKNRSCRIKRIEAHENFQDEFLTVINDFTAFNNIKQFVDTVSDVTLFSQLATDGKLDTNRGNVKIDFGFACGQNLERNLDALGVTRPRILDRTMDPVFLDVQRQLSVLTDLVSKSCNLPLYHRVGNIHVDFAARLHPDGLIPAWRVAQNEPNQFLEVHEDSNNDRRPLMSPVGVFSRIYNTDLGPRRLTKIGYSRQSLYDSIKREADIRPIVMEFLEWEKNKPDILKYVSEDLFKLESKGMVRGLAEIPCHLDRCVGVSPYLHGVVELQRVLSLSRHQCVALMYHCVTNESPYYFYSVFQEVMAADQSRQAELAAMSPINLGLCFHTRIWHYIQSNKNRKVPFTVPRRHQPHNGKRPNDNKIAMSVANLIRLTDQLCFLDGNECKKQFYHSKAIAILMKSPKDGGCHACGGLTSQTLLYSLACLGLVPVCVSRWGELASTDTAAFLERHYNLSYAEGRAEQFLLCCVAASPGKNEEMTENRVCKFGRDKKQEIRDQNRDPSKPSKTPYRDGIWNDQKIYQPVAADGKVVVWSSSGYKTMKPPATNWPQSRGKRPLSESAFWEQTTRSAKKRVMGANRLNKKSRAANVKTLSTKQLFFLLPDPLEILFQAYRKPLYLSINNLLGDVLEEGKPINSRRMRTRNKRRKKGIHMELRRQTNEIVPIPNTNVIYNNKSECIFDCGMRLALNTAPSILSRYLARLLFSKNALDQVATPQESAAGRYYLIHDNNGRTRGKRRVVAVVKEIATRRYVFAQVNDNYRTDRMDHYFFNI